MNIGVGQEFQILPYGDRIEFIPHKNIESMKGSPEGIETKIIREEDR